MPGHIALRNCSCYPAIVPEDFLSTHNIPVIHVSVEVGQNLFNAIAVDMAFRLRDAIRRKILLSAAQTGRILPLSGGCHMIGL
jgi:choline dehydrogenase-like flavoprotein